MDSWASDYLFSSYIRATNTLVAGCAIRSLYDAPEMPSNESVTKRRLDAEFVNCTFVTNSMLTYSFTSKPLMETNRLSFVNCLFWGNRYDRQITDLDCYSMSDGSKTSYWDHVSFANSCYKALDVQRIKGYENPPDGFFQCIDPKFSGTQAGVMRRYPDEPYLSLSWRSPLLGRGVASGWADDATDIAGHPRLRGGAIDIGCYQCWQNPAGTSILIK